MSGPGIELKVCHRGVSDVGGLQLHGESVQETKPGWAADLAFCQWIAAIQCGSSINHCKQVNS